MTYFRRNCRDGKPGCWGVIRLSGRGGKVESEIHACTGSTVAADNDAILCIGYSAHIRGRILRVDLSLSSLLGMHVRRLAIMRARESVRERADGRSSHGLGYNTMYAYTSGIREGTLRHTYVRPDIDRQLATVTVYNSVRLVAPVSCRNTLLRASPPRCSREPENTRRRLESCRMLTRFNGPFLR